MLNMPLAFSNLVNLPEGCLCAQILVNLVNSFDY
jgi:hypothetical protein